ncbi:MAG: YicC/YloC family endoribonuclease [Endomicrobiia bacterium]
MTGYGKAGGTINEKNITVEIKTLNSKQLDLSSRLPYLYKEKEFEIRNLLSSNIIRGKTDVSIQVEHINVATGRNINKHVVENYYTQFSQICDELQISKDAIFQSIIQLPEVLEQNEKEQLDEQEWNLLQELIKSALDNLHQFRKQEGEVLKNDITQRLKLILKKAEKLDIPEKNRIEKIRNRLKTSIEEIKNSVALDTNRLEQEIIFYLEKLDISEEKTRLKQHCKYFLETIENEDNPGKKLNFICQELGREINTIGSKANDFDIQKIVVEMKDELEKIKEQLQNIL